MESNLDAVKQGIEIENERVSRDFTRVCATQFENPSSRQDPIDMTQEAAVSRRDGDRGISSRENRADSPEFARRWSV